MAIAISRAMHDRLLDIAAAEPSREVCGLLFGTAARIDAIRPCANVSPSPQDSFEIDPAALIAAHKAERAGGARMIGCYHSHPNGLTALSDRDREAVTDGQCWIVVADGRVSAWRSTASHLSPLPIAIDPEPKNGSFASGYGATGETY